MITHVKLETNTQIIGGTGEQAQADWNQNDESAPDFIKNRICHDLDEPVEEVLFDDDVAFDGTCNGLHNLIKEIEHFTIENDVTYKISFDGDEYIFTGKDVNINGMITHGFGNLSLASSDYENTGENLCVASDGSGCNVITSKNDGTYHLKVIGEKKVSKIPEKYLPMAEIYDFLNSELMAFSIAVVKEVQYMIQEAMRNGNGEM